MTESCQACHTGTLHLDEHATQNSPYDHYRCQNPNCRAGGIHNPRTGHRMGPVFEGRTPLAASIAREPPADAMELIQS